MTSSRVRMQAEERRDLIVAAAGRVFATRRYDDVSTVELARECGVSRGLLSHYFPTKRDLYIAVIGRFLEAPRLPMPKYVEGATVEERITHSVHEWVGMVAHSKDAWLAASGFLGESRDEEISALLEDYVERTADQICEIAGLHDVRDEPSVRVALNGYSAFATAVTRRWLLGAGLTRDQLEQLLTGTLTTLVRQTLPALTPSSAARRPRRTSST
ncbi:MULTISPECIES: TetR/AcrR family transcriptional regulator [unclassified Nocardioides]|uniref:TetR/AcrR family transcriptional regulator n=1 Tax=unclassified Nocardioides TaxID=2615069 RepID=UPI0036095D50